MTAGLPPICVLIPMLGRAQKIPDVLGSLRPWTDCSVLWICSPHDTETIAACEATGERTLVVDWQPGIGDYARKINLGYRETEEEWLFLGASDLIFHPDWDKHAVAVGDRTEAGVVGTQDTRNPSVKRGLQSTHSLVRRSYIQEHGGTFDRTGEIYSEQYDHQYIDVELVEVAKLRDRWAFAKRAVVEHRHPHWGTAEDDDTYRKAMRATTQDRRLYVQRIKRAQTLHARNLRRAAL